MNTLKNVCLFLILSFSVVLSQDLQIQWAKTYDYEYANNIDFAHDGGYIFTTGDDNKAIVKIDKHGIVQEDWPLDPGQIPDYRYLQKCNEGYILIGSPNDVMLKKLDNQGQQEWEKFFYNKDSKSDEASYSYYDYGRLVIQTHDNGYILACNSRETVSIWGQYDISKDIWIIKTDPNGEKQWDCWIWGGYFSEEPRAIHQTSDNGYIVACNDNKDDYGHLYRLTSDGQIIWQKEYNEYIGYALPADDGGFYICGKNYLKKVDKDGDLIWEKTLQYELSDSNLKNMIKFDDNSYLLCGNVFDSDTQSWKNLLIKTDNFGNKIWEKTFTEISGISQVLKITNNEFILFGSKGGLVTIVKIIEKIQQDPTKIELLDPVNYKMGVGTQVCLDWTSISNASSYLLELDDDSDMSSPIISKTITNSSNCIINDLSYSTQYYWRVMAQFPDESGNWSDIRTFITMLPPHIESSEPEGYYLSYVDVGDQYYTDRDYTITELPDQLNNCIWIKTQNSDKYLTDDNYIQFQLTRDATVYIAYDNRASAVPQWLTSNFEQTQFTIESTDEYCNFNVWKGKFSAGDVTLGANLATGAEGVQTNYVVFIDIPIQMLDPRENKSGVGKNLYLSWEALGNFGKYDFQISDNQDMSNPFYNITNIEYTRYKIRDLEYNKDYYWRVKAHNRNDEDAWCQTHKFHTMDDHNIYFWVNSNYALSWLEENDQYYVDRNDVVLSIPDPLKNLLWIKTKDDNADIDEPIGHLMEIEFKKEATLYVGFDSRAVSLPNWVTNYYKNTGLTIKVSDEANELNIWSRNVTKGWVYLGFNMAKGAENINSHYVVLIDTNQVQPLSAHFSSDVTSGVSPLTVNFSDSSQGLITSWAWNFGDGKTSTEKNPSHTYGNAESYTVSLTVSGMGGSDTIEKENYITVYETTPLAKFGSDKISGELPLTVNFSDSSHGIIESWVWNFGDESTSTEQNPSHTYENAGRYTVSLTVSGPYGSDTLTKENYIIVKKAVPIANFGSDVIMGQAPLTVSFRDSSLGEIDSWLWKFGDGLTSTAQNPTHVYTSADSFTVTLFVYGPGGSNTMIKSNYIIVDHPTSINDMAGIPKKFNLLPNYPNPFNPQTTIRFAVPKRSFVKINVYDVNGKRVNNLFSGIKNPGYFSLTWDATGFPSGMYFIKMDTDTFTSVKKCILVK